MATCTSCGSPRPSAEAACPRCGVAPQAEGSELLTALEFEETRAMDATAAAGRLAVEIRPRLEYAGVPAASDPVVHLMVDVTPYGPPIAEPKSGPVAHVILVLDLSASMNHPDKYPVLTEALSGMLYDLAKPGSAEVLLSVVVFAYGSETLFRDVPASKLNPRDVLAKIDRSALRFGRYTDVVGGLKRAARIAYDQLTEQKSMPTRIYLLTDGQPQDMPGSRAMMARIAKMPVDVDGLAFGNDADVGLLQELVSGGRGGTVKHVRSETLSDAFDRIAEVAQNVVSNRAQFSFELAPGVVGSGAYRYRPGRHRFGENSFGEGSAFRTDLGTLESGRTYSLLFELRLPETDADRTEIGRITLRLPGAGGGVFEELVSVPRTEGAGVAEPDGEVVAARDVLAALSASDPKTQLRALRVRRKLYIAERRDPHVVAVIDKAIASLEQAGSLAALSAAEQATLRSHTVTAGGSRPAPARRELAAG